MSQNMEFVKVFEDDGWKVVVLLLSKQVNGQAGWPYLMMATSFNQGIASATLELDPAVHSLNDAETVMHKHFTEFDLSEAAAFHLRSIRGMYEMPGASEHHESTVAEFGDRIFDEDGNLTGKRE